MESVVIKYLLALRLIELVVLVASIWWVAFHGPKGPFTTKRMAVAFTLLFINVVAMFIAVGHLRSEPW